MFCLRPVFRGRSSSEDSRRGLVEQVSWFDSVDGDRVQRTVPVNRDSLPGPSVDTIGSLVWLSERRMDCIDTNEHV